MANDGQIVFEVTADGKHAIADIKDITRAIEQESKKWDNAAKESTNNIGNSFGSMLKKLTVGFSAVKIGKELLELGKEAVNLASDLEEVQNVVDVTFGTAGAAKIESWAKEAGTQFGLTETQAKKFTSTLGAMMKSAGMSGNEIVSMSTDLAGLAADMASFYNLDFDTAFQKIRSGISGETEPLKQLGINMSVANLNAFALQKGLEKTFEQMDQGEQTMLRYQYIMSATADAQGDFARTSDGYANGIRTLETNIDSLKTKLGTVLLPVINEAVAGINALFPEDGGNRKTVLDDFAGIDERTEAELAKISNTAQDARDLLEILNEITSGGKASEVSGVLSGENTPESKQDETDVQKFLAMGNESAEAVEGLRALGFSTEEITEKQNLWLETCERLVQTIPGLSEIINTETGEVKGGTKAVNDYIDAWEKGQKKLVLLGALEEKESALASRFSDLPGLELDMALAEKKVRDQKKKMDALREKYGIDNGYAEAFHYTAQQTEATEEWNEEVKVFNELQAKLSESKSAYNAQKQALEEAKVAIEEYRAAIVEEYGSIEEAKKAGVEWSEEMKESAKTVVAVAAGAWKALADHVESVRDTVRSAVDSTVKGFEKIGKAGDDTRKSLEENSRQLGEKEQLLAGYGGFSAINAMGEEAWNKLPPEIQNAFNEVVKLKQAQDELNNSINQYSPQSMIDGLQSQIDYIDEYLANLDKAKELGLSDELLAQLSDGSKESAEYLAQIAGADSATIEQLNSKYAELQQKKEGFTNSLADQQLTVDEVYKALLEDAQKAVDALDMGQAAQDNAGKTVQGLIDGIRNNVPGVEGAVDEVLAQLARLTGFNIGFNLGNSGAPQPTFFMKTLLNGEFETGLNFVPFDGFLASLHEGEGILTAEENKIWQRFRNGGSAIDYDTMGGVMRDNIKPGGNVYLDGRIVGNVISDQQGRSYRQLQRSGWQP